MTGVSHIEELHGEPARQLERRVVQQFYRRQAFAPDRVRSFLSYLKRRNAQYGFVDLPANLYSASEGLARSDAALRLSMCDGMGEKRDVTMRVFTASPDIVLSVEFGALQCLTEFLDSAALDILVAGARMLGVEHAMLATVGDSTDTALHKLALSPSDPPVAVWVGAQSPLRSEPDGKQWFAAASLQRAEWDGAELWIRRKLESAPDQPPSKGQLQRALRAPDWKVRVRAMIEATRLGFADLGVVINSLEIPETSVPGVTNTVRHMLLAMRKASMLLLSGMPVPVASSATPDTRDGMQAHLLRLMAGKPAAFEDDFATLIDSLSRTEIASDGTQGERRASREES
jgi:hypothetical protein